MSDMAQLFDVFFNGRPARREPGTLDGETIGALVCRGRSTVRFKGKLYTITVEPAATKSGDGKAE